MESTSDTSAEKPQVSSPPREPVPTLDWLLETLVTDANHNDGYDLPITLLTAGGTVSGRLIGAKEYFTAAGEWLSKAHGGSKYGNDLKESWTAIGEEFIENAQKNNQTEFNFIHLKEVRYLGNVILPEPGLLWRGRLSEVTGFSLGASVPKGMEFTAKFERETQG